MSFLNEARVTPNTIQNNMFNSEWEREKVKPMARKRKDSESSEVREKKKSYNANHIPYCFRSSTGK